MKRALLTFVVVFLAMSSTGCVHRNLARNGCSGGCGGCQQGCQACQGGCPSGACRGGGGFFNGLARNGGAGGGMAGGMPGGMASGPADGGGCKTCGRGMSHLRAGGPLQYDPSVHYSDGGMPGPSTAQVGYPYYTTRGPRDFLLNNPPSLGR